jgi:hypothetical protein
MPLPGLCIFDRPKQSQKVRWFWYRVFTFAVPYPVILWHLLLKPEISVGINDNVQAGRPRNRNLIRRREKRPGWFLRPLSLLNNAEGYSVCSFFQPLPIHGNVLQIPHVPYGVA